jgi:ornithine cyclodeaminase/alanine dehydrogenase-like protein (mu-crystallin family)
MRFLTSHDLAPHFSMDDIIEMVESAYREEGLGRVTSKSRTQLRSDGTHTFMNCSPAIMPALGVTGVSTYTGGNKGKPLVQKVILLYSTEDGRLLSVLEADWISWMRTGATSGVATKYLAQPDASVIGIFGAGKQARSQLMAMSAVRPIERALVYSPTVDRRERFVAEMTERLGISVQTVDSPDAILDEVEIICTATTSHTPVFDGHRVLAGTHVNAIGQHYPDRREVDSILLNRSRLVVDDRSRALQEDGELLIPMQRGQWDDSQIHATLGEVVAGQRSGRTGDEISLFTSGGIASEILAVAAGVYSVAEDENLGIQIDWQVNDTYLQPVA